MIFWLICVVLTLGVAGVLAAPLLRTAQTETVNPDIAVYKAQLSEITRDLERGILPEAEAERARAEIARRLLAANKEVTTTPQSGRASPLLMGGIAIAICAFTFGTYAYLGAPGYDDLPLEARIATSDEMRESRPSQAALEALAPPRVPVDAPQDFMDAMEQLRTIAPMRPDDPEAWSRLAYYEGELRNFAAAAAAQAHLLDIYGAEATIDEMRLLVDFQVAAANGFVSPEAEAVIRIILDRDPQNIGARYYLGSLYNMTDRPDFAYQLWRDFAENGDPNSFYVTSARAQIEDAAYRAGIDYSLPEVRGPSAADIANAESMTEEDRTAMINGMVAGLAERLASEGGPATDWARLITAYGALGETDNARMVWVEAQEVFGANADSMATLRDAAQTAGLLE
ncbi:c-type cytochrome biogenesis protein CcmI [Loktanella sp. D2R18]|uniref:c-type cytochrome biogenesis protein CcmI n=1 Tax=Rhodobacterales TaxID=204455 RepID=UPI000DEBC02A|nr:MULTISPECIES: c-type cytochrome biogenesis protein CcmI [Rhodobacterales]MDO6589794.1 c-type cytochrome biogenesis protein CcmI [Yoonia sp. 1_MG-2023]RBW44413.1 c-type cytochrome biogenesis protein CcmI [Loktanella sp. D2R18]